jgi:hypothetical protein
LDVDPKTAASRPVMGQDRPKAASVTRALIAAAAALAVGLAAWPLSTDAPAGDIDSAWEAGLHMAAADHLQQGDQLLWTHGPLGFLVSPALWYRWTALGGWLLLAAGLAGLAAVLFVALRRWMPLAAAVVLVLVLTIRVDRPAPDLVSLVFMLGALVRLQNPGALRRPWLWLGSGALLAAFETLVKFSAGASCAATLVVAAVGLSTGEWKRRALIGGTAVSAYVIAVAVEWLACGQHLTNLWMWSRGSIELSQGYVAMAITAPGRPVDFWFMALWALLMLVLLVRWWTGARRAAGIVLVVVAGWLEAKHGLVRDNNHVLQLFLFLAALPLVVRTMGSGRWVALGASAVALVGLVHASPLSIGRLTDAPGRFHQAVSQLADTLSAGRVSQIQAASRRNLRTELGLDAGSLAILRGRTVQVDPWDTEAAWAYHLQWDPVPVYQSYSAYTAALDQIDADALAGTGAPSAILRARHGSVDNRIVDYEAPRYYLAEICHYRQARLTPRWQVLLRLPTDRCGKARRLGQAVAVPAGRTVAVPSPTAADYLVFASIALPPDPLDSVLSLVLKPLHHPVISLDGARPQRLVQANVGGPLIMWVPADTPVGPGPGGLLQVARLDLTGITGTARVQFWELPLAPTS